MEQCDWAGWLVVFTLAMADGTRFRPAMGWNKRSNFCFRCGAACGIGFEPGSGGTSQRTDCKKDADDHDANDEGRRQRTGQMVGTQPAYRRFQSHGGDPSQHDREHERTGEISESDDDGHDDPMIWVTWVRVSDRTLGISRARKGDSRGGFFSWPFPSGVRTGILTGTLWTGVWLECSQFGMGGFFAAGFSKKQTNLGGWSDGTWY